MAVIALTSGGGSPGVSTSALGLALGWTRPVLLIEADPTGSSTLPGYLRDYQSSSFVSVLDLVQHHHRTGQLPQLLEAASLVPGSNLRIITAVRTPNQSTSISPVIWDDFLTQFQDFDRAGIDVIIDLGRLGLEHYATRLLVGANLVLLTLRSTLPSVYSARGWTPMLTPERGVSSAGLMIIGPGHPYSEREISATLKLPSIAPLPLDPVTAEVFSTGAPPGRRFGQSPLSRALAPAAAAIQQYLAETRNRMEGR